MNVVDKTEQLGQLYGAKTGMTPLQRLGTWMCHRDGGVFTSRPARCTRCRRAASYRCMDHPSTIYRHVVVCDQHNCLNCTRFREQPQTIRGAPMPLLEAAQLYLEQRLIWLERQRSNHKRRCTTKWLGRWLAIVQEEIRRRKPTVLRRVIIDPKTSQERP